MDEPAAAETADVFYEIRLVSGPAHSALPILARAAIANAGRHSTIRLHVQVVRRADGGLAQSYDYLDATEAGIHLDSLRERAARMTRADFEAELGLEPWSVDDPRARAHYRVEIRDAPPRPLHRPAQLVWIVRRADDVPIRSFQVHDPAEARWRAELLREQLARMTRVEFEAEYQLYG